MDKFDCIQTNETSTQGETHSYNNAIELYALWSQTLSKRNSLCFLSAFMNLSSTDKRWKSALIVYYDFEFSGNIRHNFGTQCSIHQIAAQCKNETFFCQINPYLSKETVEPPVDTKYFMPSKEDFLKENAYTFKEGYEQFISFILRLLLKRKKKWVCLISHNGFRGDKIVLEHELLYHGLQPVGFYFMDSLLYIRETYPGLQSYSLENIYEKMFGENYYAHNAKTDTKALFQIMKKINRPLHGVLYPMLSVPWRNVAGIGYHSEQSMLQFGIFDLTSLFVFTQGNLQKTKIVLARAGVLISEKLMENIFHWYKHAKTVLLYRHESVQIAANSTLPLDRT